MNDLNDFHHEFLQEVYGSADADGHYAEDAFFEKFCSYLVEAGDLETADRVQYLSQRGLRIDGYGGDPESSGGVLSLIIADFKQAEDAEDIETLTATEMDAIFKRAINFLTKVLDRNFRNSLEETTPAFGLADLISARWPHTIKVRILLISNRILSKRVDGREAGEVEGIPVTFGVWDLNRLHRFATGGQGREDIEIDMEQDFGSCLQVLPAHLTEADYEAYLVVISGEQLAAIYDRWGPRLLEQNVRVFLQARGNVNKGIRITLESNPKMFFAYNNGITATADSVETRQTRNGLMISKFKNLQIVNGGQTTASIHAARKNKEIDLSRVFVQMKLSIINPLHAQEVVQKISEYANTQNRVNAADFFANHPFHIRFQQFSRRMYAPSPDGSFRESKWFYERARGQYQDARTPLTPADRRKFDLEYPKPQMVTKTDLAKFLMLWRGFPEIVSKGAQKNFAEFANIIGKEWSKNADAFNELYFQRTIAKAIIFKRTEKLVTEAPWYEGGYRANIVAYAIAKIGYDVERSGKVVDFVRIWREQSVFEAMEQALIVSAKVAHEILESRPSGSANITEWAKKDACWTRVKERHVAWPPAWTQSLVLAGKDRETKNSARKDQQVLNGIEAETKVMKAGAAFWRDVREWGEARKLLTPKELGILEVCASMPAKHASEKQAMVAINALVKLQDEGCPFTLDD